MLQENALLLLRNDAVHLATGILIGGLKVITRLILNFFHERAWSRIQGGFEKNPAVRGTGH